jgi:hypothetical protein
MSTETLGLVEPTLSDATVPETRRSSVRVRQAEGPGRLLFVDFVRLFASFQMLHGHTIDALLDRELREGPVFGAWSWQRGLVSVSFLFAAGIAFTLSTLTRLEAFHADRSNLTRRWKRIAWLVTLGYLMHFPAEALSDDPARASASLNGFLIADVLQCIGVSMALLQGLASVLRNARRVTVVAGVLALGFFAFAPLADAVNVDGPLRPLANYLTHRGGSLFPLFPWAGYVFAGVVAAAILAPRGTSTPPHVAARRAALVAAGGLGIWAIARWFPWRVATDDTTYHAVPSFALLKLAVVLVLVLAFALLALRVTGLPRVLRVLAGESLMLYWFHLTLLYGAGIGLQSWIGPTLSLSTTLVVASLVVVGSALVGIGWHRLKAWRAAH